MVRFRKDDGGRAAAGYRGDAGDCVVRSLSILLDYPYKPLYLEMAREQGKLKDRKGRKMARSARNGVDKRAYTKVFERHGLVKVRLPKGQRPTISEAHERYGNCIITTAKHIFAVVDGAVRDTWDCRNVTRQMLVCDECEFILAEGSVATTGVGYRKNGCEWCGEQHPSGYFAVDVTYERKAMSVWVRGDQ